MAVLYIKQNIPDIKKVMYIGSDSVKEELIAHNIWSEVITGKEL